MFYGHNQWQVPTWSGQDGEKRLHASVDVVRHVAVEQPRPGVPDQHLHHLKGPREQIHNICSVAFAILSQRKENISVQRSASFQTKNSVSVTGNHFSTTTVCKSPRKDFKEQLQACSWENKHYL